MRQLRIGDSHERSARLPRPASFLFLETTQLVQVVHQGERVELNRKELFEKMRQRAAKATAQHEDKLD